MRNKPNVKKLLLVFALLSIINPFNPNFATAKTYNYIYYYNTGVDCQNKGKYDLAIKNYQKALSLNSKYSKARNNMMYSYISLANECSKNKKYIESIPNYNKAISMNPNMAELHYNLGLTYHIVGQTDFAIKSYEKALKLKPSFCEARNNLSFIYFSLGIKSANEGLYDKAIQYYKKGLEYDPNDAKAYYNLGVCYGMVGKSEESILSYRKSLSIDPSFASANNNLEVSLKKKEEAELAKQINNLIPASKAPSKIYRLVKLNQGANPAAVGKLYEILDFIWGDPEGQKLLLLTMKNDIPINITKGSGETNSHIDITSYKNVITYGGAPIITYNSGQNVDIKVNIGEDHILSFKNPAATTHTKIYSFHVVLHELCHAVKSSIVRNTDNAMSEEITASMVGYNIASRVIKGRNLTEKETEEYAKLCMQGVLKDDHRLLPVYNSFLNEIQKCGIYPPYPYLYQNIPELYKAVRDNPECQKVDSLEQLISN